ncbi:MAG: AAA family ATPase [Fervidicoccaceae archaeon]
MIVVVTGTPGTGKTLVSRRLEERLGACVVNVARLALERELVVDYDFERETSTIDEPKLRIELLREIELAKRRGCELLVIDTSQPCLLRGALVDLVLVLRARPEVLEVRLRERGWPRIKIEENVEAERAGVVASEALECLGERVVEVDSERPEALEQIVELISELLEEKFSYPLGGGER